MDAWVSQAISFYGLRNTRERFLIAASLLALTWGLWLVLLADPAFEAQDKMRADIKRLAGELQVADGERKRLQLSDTSAKVEQLRGDRAALAAALDLRTRAVESALSGFVAPEKVPQLLQTLLSGYPGLTLHSIQSVAPTPIKDLGLPVFVHPVRIELEGSYFDVMAYLEALEDTPWELHWRRMDYAVGDYPVARVRIEVETLSNSRAWVGV